jgi:hypothetical protein
MRPEIDRKRSPEASGATQHPSKICASPRPTAWKGPGMLRKLGDRFRSISGPIPVPSPSPGCRCTKFWFERPSRIVDQTRVGGTEGLAWWLPGK